MGGVRTCQLGTNCVMDTTDAGIPFGAKGVCDYCTGFGRDLAVDLRRESRSFGRSVGGMLSDENGTQRWIPEGLSHAIVVTNPVAEVLYKMTDDCFPDHERRRYWNDPGLDVRWPVSDEQTLTATDAAGQRLNEVELPA